MCSKKTIQYSLGALLYTPANHAEVADRILNRYWPQLTSISLCLEDSIQENGLKQAEKQLRETLRILYEAKADNLPFIFVRVRNPEHLRHVHQLISDYE